MKPLRWLPALLWATLIFVASSRSNPLPVSMPFVGVDKVVHTLIYGILSVLVFFALGPVQSLPPKRAMHDGGAQQASLVWLRAGITVVLVTIYGVSDEFHQSFVPGRTPDVFDVVADACGAIAAAGIMIFRRHIRVTAS